MSFVPLGELMANKVPSLDPAKLPNETFELWSIPAFDAGAPEQVTGAQIGSAKKVLQPDDVLLSRIVPHIRRSWVVENPQGQARQLGSGEWIVFRSKKVHPPYLRHVLVGDAFHVQFMNTVAGVGGSLLRARPEAVKQIQVPLPPLPEQRRIAAILDQADAVRRLRRQSLSRLSDLRQAIFYEMFGDLSCHPRTTCLYEIAEIQKSLVDPRKLENQEKLHVGPEHIEPNSGVIDWDRVNTSREDGLISGKNAFDNEGIIYSKIRPYLNKVALPDREGLCSADMYVLKPIAGRSNRTFVQALMMGRDFLAYAETVSNRANIPKLNREQVDGYRFACPSFENQQEFERVMNGIAGSAKMLQAARNEQDSLFASLQHRAFRGEL